MIFYYDVVCPYAYLASTRVEAMAARAGVAIGERSEALRGGCAAEDARLIDWQPILLGGVFRAIAAPDQPAATMPPAKARLNLLDLKRYAALYGIPLEIPAGHPRRSVEAMRLLHAVDGNDRIQLTHALYRAYFAEGRDIADPTVLTSICVQTGITPARDPDAPAVKESLRAATAQAVADGVFGVPAFIVGPARKLYWGQDRMHLVERALCAK